MDRDRASRGKKGRWLRLAALAVAAVLCGGPAPAQPPGGDEAAKPLDPAKARRLQEGERLRGEALRLANSGNLTDAVRSMKSALAIEREVLGASSEAVARTLATLSGLHEARGDWDSAREPLREVLALRERQPDRKPWRVTDARLALADLERRAAMTPDQRRRLKEADALLEKARSESARGRIPGARAAVLDALSIQKELLGADHPDYAATLATLSILYQTQGDYARAAPLAREARDVVRKALGADHPDYAGSLNNLGFLYREVGDYARAEPLLREARDLARAARGADDADYAATVANLGALYHLMGDYARAEPLYREARDVKKKALGPDDPEYASSLNSLAALYQAVGDYARAAPLAREARDVVRKALGADHPDYAVTLNNLAALYQARGDYARAEPLYREALDLKKSALVAGHPDYASSLNNLAALYEDMGLPARARPLLEQALSIISAFTAGTSAALGERQRLRLFDSQRKALDAYLGLGGKANTPPTDLYLRVLAWKGAAVGDPAENRLARARPELRPVVAELEQVRARLARLAFVTPSGDQRPAWRQRFNDLGARKEQLEADLAAAGRRGRPPGRVEPDDVAAALPDDAALVDFFVYHQFGPPGGGQRLRRKEARLLAFVVRRAKPVTVVPLGANRPVEDAVAAWRRALDAGRPDGLRTAAAELGRLVWEPLRPHLGDARTILIAPDGGLASCPFAALPGRRPGSYLIEDLAVGYVPSGRSIVDAPGAPSGRAGRGLLAVGDVDFQADPGRAVPSDRPVTLVQADGRRAGFKPLPGTGPEARRACEVFRAAFADQPAELLTGSAPTEGQLKRRLDGGRWRVVHLGTHGFFESPARVAALRDAVRRDGSSDPAAPGNRRDDAALALAPLLHSGVVLAGGGRAADAPGSGTDGGVPPREDGILTAEEVQALDLDGTEMVVLSACQTGLGDLEYGQGVLGLQRAFHAAGARAVVASLWKVDDAATGALMERFYTNLWARRLPRLEALRQAQMAVLNEPGLVARHRAEAARRGIGDRPEKLPGGGAGTQEPAAARGDPALWAAFVLSGDVR